MPSRESTYVKANAVGRIDFRAKRQQFTGSIARKFLHFSCNPCCKRALEVTRCTARAMKSALFLARLLHHRSSQVVLTCWKQFLRIGWAISLKKIIEFKFPRWLMADTEVKRRRMANRTLNLDSFPHSPLWSTLENSGVVSDGAIEEARC